MEKDLIDHFRLMAETVAVQQALNAYHHAVSKTDLERILDTYAPDGTWELNLGGDPMSFSGRDGLRQGYQTMFIDECLKFDPPQGPEVQINSPATIRIEGERAYASSVMLVVLRPHNDIAQAVTGFYDDVLRKIEGIWKFEKRTFTLNFMWPATAGR